MIKKLACLLLLFGNIISMPIEEQPTKWWKTQKTFINGQLTRYFGFYLIYGVTVDVDPRTNTVIRVINRFGETFENENVYIWEHEIRELIGQIEGSNFVINLPYIFHSI